MFHLPVSDDETSVSRCSNALGSTKPLTSSSSFSQTRKLGNVSLPSSDSSDADNDFNEGNQFSKRSLKHVSPANCVPLSINADISDSVVPLRSRVRGILPHAKTPHRCQSQLTCKHDVRVERLLAREDDNYSETDPLIPKGTEHNRRTPDVSANVNSRRSPLASVCSTADLHRPGAYHSNHSASADDITTSNDSHCHSNIKKGGFDKKARTRLILASVLCLLFMTGEMVGGLLAHSLAIISDAAHLLTDFASFMISLLALYLAHRPATKKLSFGWYRIEILGAFVSILMLWVLTGILVYSAVLRIMEDEYEIDAKIMLITAATGVAFNIVLGTTLHQHSHSHGGHGHSHGASDHSSKKTKTDTSQVAKENQVLSSPTVQNYGSFHDLEADGRTGSSDEDHEGHGHSHVHKGSNINVKAAFIHVLGDLFQSVGVLVAAFIIYYKPEWKIADPICTFLFSLFVLITTLTIMRDILVVLMEGTPRGINFTEVRNTFFEVEGVLDIHNLRVWSLTMDKIALSVHLAVDKQSDPHKVLKAASIAIQQKFNISETTMQIEEYVTEMIDCQDCQGPQF